MCRDSIEHKILSASLKFVPECGFTKTSIMKGATSLGLPEISHGVIERGPIQLVDHFTVEALDRMKEEMQSMELEKYSRSDDMGCRLIYLYLGWESRRE